MAGVNNKPVIFLAFANDRDDTVGYLRNLPDEARRLRDVLKPAEQAGLCAVEVRSNSTAADIFKVFQDPKYRNRIAIFHYGGHANGYQLLLESPEGKAAAANAGGLAAFLAQQQGLQLVFLNGCSTQPQTQELLDANISLVISTSRSIDDKVATDFAFQFYQGLAGNAPIRTAYDEAAASVRTAKGGNTRTLYFGDKDDPKSPLEADRWPWNLYVREGSEGADGWNLPDAANDPLAGLPPLPEQDLPERPYRQLAWFERKHADVFFGRGHQIRQLYNQLTAPRTAPIILFYGQSGVGKSSILDAGLIPRLDRDHEVRYRRRDQQQALIGTLQSAIISEACDVPIETGWRDREKQLGKPLIVFLDQVEEIYTRPHADMSSDDELNQLLEVLKATFVESDDRPRGKLVLGFRKEWLAELEGKMKACELPRKHLFLEPLSRRGIIEVVQGPARSERLRDHYGLEVEDGLAEIIANDLLKDCESAIAPTLQILLTKMWETAKHENYGHPHFSQKLYNRLKRDGILLRDFLDQQIAAFGKEFPNAVESGLLLDIVALHTTPLGTADQCTVEQLKQQYAHLGAALPDLLQKCQSLYLLTIPTGDQIESSKTTRLAHDTLAPLIRERFDQSDKPGQRARRILDNRSVDWKDDCEGAPLDEADLKVVENGTDGTRDLNRDEVRLVQASHAARQCREREKQEQQKKLDQSRKRTNTAIIGGVSVAAILTVVSVGFGIWGNHNAWVADQERTAAIQNMTTSHLLLADIASERVLPQEEVFWLWRSVDEMSPEDVRLAPTLDKLSWKAWALDPPWLHRGSITAAAFCRDGQTVLTGGSDGTARLWDAVTGELKGPPLRHRSGFEGGVGLGSDGMMALSSDGKTAVTVTAKHSSEAHLWDTATGRLKKSLEHVDPVNTATFSPDGKTFLTTSGVGGITGLARLWNVVTGELKGPPMEHVNEYIYVAVFSPDGDTVLTGSAREDSTGAATLWDIATRKKLKTMEHENPVHAVAFSPDGKTVLTGSGQYYTPRGEPVSYEGEARLWVAATGEPITTPPLKHKGIVTAVAFSPDGKTFVTASEGETIEAHVWDAVTDKPKELALKLDPLNTERLQGLPKWLAMVWPDDPILTVVFNPDRQAVVIGTGDVLWFDTTASGDTARLLDVWTGAPIGPELHRDDINSIAFSPDGGTLVAGSQVIHATNGSIIETARRSWYAEVPFSWGDFAPQHNQRIEHAVTFGLDGQIVLTGVHEKTTLLWDARTGVPLGPPLQHNGSVRSVVVSPDGQTVLTIAAVTENEREARLWDAPTGKSIKRLKHDASVHAVAFSPDGKTVLTGSDDKTARLWEARTGAPTGSTLHHQGIVLAVAFSPDGKTILTGCGDNTARLWNAQTGKPQEPPLTHQDAVAAVAFSRDGQTVMTRDHKTVRTWESRTGEPNAPPLPLGDDVASVTFSPEGQTVMVVEWIAEQYESQPRLWDMRTGLPKTATLEPFGAGLVLAFSPDGRTIVTGTESYDSKSGEAHLWYAETGMSIKPLKHDAPVLAVAFSPNGKTVVTVSGDMVRLWETPSRAVDPRKARDWLQLSVEAQTGLERNDSAPRRFRRLTAGKWFERYQQARKRGAFVDLGEE